MLIDLYIYTQSSLQSSIFLHVFYIRWCCCSMQLCLPSTWGQIPADSIRKCNDHRDPKGFCLFSQLQLSWDCMVLQLFLTNQSHLISQLMPNLFAWVILNKVTHSPLTLTLQCNLLATSSPRWIILCSDTLMLWKCTWWRWHSCGMLKNNKRLVTIKLSLCWGV